MVQRLVEDQCEIHHMETSVLHGKLDSIQAKMDILNLEKCENL